MLGRLLCLLALLLAPTVTRAAARSPLAPGEHHLVVGGVRLWYRVAGRTSGTPVVFLHGGPGQGSQSFATLAGPALERSHRMVYLDQRGSGQSERPWNRAYSMSLLVEDLERLRRALRTPKIAIIGHSVGTMIAMEYAAKYPQHVDRMVLAASGPDIPAAFNAQCDRVAIKDPAVYARAKADVVAGSALTCNLYKGAFQGRGLQEHVNSNMFPDPRTEEIVREADNANGLRNTGELSKAMIDAGLLEFRFGQAARLTMPVLVVAGGRDLQTGVGPQAAFARSLPRGRMLVYPEAGHFMFVEQPDRFAADVLAFFRER